MKQQTIVTVLLVSTALTGGFALLGVARADVTAPSLLPVDITAFIERTDTCIHWGGEPVDSDPQSEPRRRQIEDALKDLQCEKVASDATRLRQRYITSPPIVKAIDEASKTFN